MFGNGVTTGTLPIITFHKQTLQVQPRAPVVYCVVAAGITVRQNVALHTAITIRRFSVTTTLASASVSVLR